MWEVVAGQRLWECSKDHVDGIGELCAPTRSPIKAVACGSRQASLVEVTIDLERKVALMKDAPTCAALDQASQTAQGQMIHDEL